MWTDTLDPTRGDPVFCPLCGAFTTAVYWHGLSGLLCDDVECHCLWWETPAGKKLALSYTGAFFSGRDFLEFVRA